MTKPQIKIVDTTSGLEIIRDANAQELAQIEIDAATDLAAQAQIEAKAVEKQALLDRLGITADEAKLLLG